MKLKHLLFVGFIMILTFGLAACSGEEADGDSEGQGNGDDNSTADEDVTLHVAALESAYGEEMWRNIIEDYEAIKENVSIELTIEKNLEEVIRPQMQAGDYPDVFLLATDREEALTETMIKENGLENITDVLDMTIPGEDVAVKDKLLEGFSDTLATNPYGDGEMYMAPMFYSPSGMFYNAGLFDEQGWEVPETWDDMWELGDQATEQDMSLFTYPIAGYFDTFIGSMLYASGGADFFNSAMTYEEGVWETEEAERVLQTVEQLAEYTHPNTVANANPNDFTKNQQLILDNEALFMPNGAWVVEEMAEAPRSDNFEWGMTSIPAFESGEGERYTFTFFEQMWVPAEAENTEAAKEFIAYMYSDEAADTFLEAGAVQPIEGMTEKMEGQQKEFYSIYDEDVLPAMGTFASTNPVPGVSISDALYGSIDSVVNGEMTYEEWQATVQEASDQLRPEMQ
ncbi:carbohydrate ABC transporter substrate-binding protein [Lentibacillus sp. CBA3610]|uniref:carbohydrate ABC transporter substrate-binding protein n=1 Tax=Lentibacillus sp. CBA3610 TaxID=2518176 RepID=UPI001596080B|nr:carbohydrate ABC transporter substrate-binding protein [Lentibacillus sp. CBA3610]QKY70357.1 carbohydrate ABC transporter substrate-binding protein [Lentibacillus sp. CBA3610]